MPLDEKLNLVILHYVNGSSTVYAKESFTAKIHNADKPVGRPGMPQGKYMEIIIPLEDD
jgi:hypothetical protein